MMSHSLFKNLNVTTYNYNTVFVSRAALKFMRHKNVKVLFYSFII